MSEPTLFDQFLADPCGVWAAHAAQLSNDEAVQAARSSRAFREQLKSEVLASVERTGSFADADRACAILCEVFDAQDIAGLFGELSRVRSPADWAAEFAKRFAR